MGKVVMPKNSALLPEIVAALKIYYEANDWLTNDIYKEKLKAIIGDNQYESSYTKKNQILSYFGFTVWQNISNKQSPKRITNLGKEMHKAIEQNDEEKIKSILMYSLENMTFGRNNCGCPDSNSDVEPPALFIRAVLDLEYLTYHEFGYLLWQLNDIGKNYSDIIKHIKETRINNTSLASNIIVDDNASEVIEDADDDNVSEDVEDADDDNANENVEEANQFEKYKDCKPIMFLIRWKFLQESETGTPRRISIAPDVYKKFYNRLRNLKIYNIDKNIDLTSQEQEKFEFGEIVKDGTNIILYGVPGSGKSRKIKDEFCNDENRMMRIVFHPDYTYSDFIGQILPKKENENLSYDFTPGPFTEILKMAVKDPFNSYYLIIEEINRGNAAAIFGETFQLLDRIVDETDSSFPIGTSEYGITNFYIAEHVYEDPFHKVRLPSNLSILGTMNTSDQNIFSLDTAFQRRWEMHIVNNSFDTVSNDFKNHKILDTTVTWEKFCTTINNLIASISNKNMISEDKRLGVYFVHPQDLLFDDLEDDNTIDSKTKALIKRKNSRFSEKVLKYLWDDAFKYCHEDVFDTSKYNTLEEVLSHFNSKRNNSRFEIFTENVSNSLTNNSSNLA